MPLKKGNSPDVISENIRELVKAGHPQKQAEAIAEKTAREHAEDDVATLPVPPVGAMDAKKVRQMKLAFDRSSVRSKDIDGRLHIELTTISAESVDDYYGREIVDWELLGLEPDAVYSLYRPADELERAVDSFNRMPVLMGHAHATALDPKKDLVIGSTGESALFEAPYLKNSMVVWDQDAIASIESREAADLSCGYYYRPILQSGEWNGKPYTIKMTQIVGSHLAVVPDGRVPGALIEDSALTIGKILDMSKKTKAPTGMSLLARVAFQALAPKMAADSVEGFKKLSETKVTAQSWVDTIKPALSKLKLASDASIPDFKEVIGALDAAAEEDKKQAEDEDEDDEQAMDGDPVEKLLKEKGLSADEMKMVKDSYMPKAAIDEDKADVDYKKESKAEQAEDEDEEDKKEDKVKDKQAMDAAIQTRVNAAVKLAEDRANARLEAHQFVRPWVGELAMAFDSAEDVYKAALDTLKVDTMGAHPSAYRAILSVVKKPGSEQSHREISLAMDAAFDADFQKRFPNAGRLI